MTSKQIRDFDTIEAFFSVEHVEKLIKGVRVRTSCITSIRLRHLFWTKIRLAHDFRFDAILHVTSIAHVKSKIGFINDECPRRTILAARGLWNAEDVFERSLDSFSIKQRSTVVLNNFAAVNDFWCWEPKSELTRTFSRSSSSLTFGTSTWNHARQAQNMTMEAWTSVWTSSLMILSLNVHFDRQRSLSSKRMKTVQKRFLSLKGQKCEVCSWDEFWTTNSKSCHEHQKGLLKRWRARWNVQGRLLNAMEN